MPRAVLVAIATLAISSGCGGPNRPRSALGGLVTVGGVAVAVGALYTCVESELNAGTCDELGVALPGGVVLAILGGFIIASAGSEPPPEPEADDDGGSAAVVTEGATAVAARRVVRAAAEGDCETVRAEMVRIAVENPALYDVLARRGAVRSCGV